MSPRIIAITVTTALGVSTVVPRPTAVAPVSVVTILIKPLEGVWRWGIGESARLGPRLVLRIERALDALAASRLRVGVADIINSID